MITIRIITEENKQDIRLPNEPFPLFGQMIPSYRDGQWDYKIEYWEEDKVTSMCFPDESYDFAAMSENSVFVGAYDDGVCIGLAVLQDGFFRYMYLYDLKVNASYRGQGVGRMLIDKAKEIARSKGYRGLYTIGQDNNLGACLFYVKNGFYIGGLDTNVYKGTSQEDKADILFYLDG